MEGSQLKKRFGHYYRIRGLKVNQTTRSVVENRKILCCLELWCGYELGINAGHVRAWKVFITGVGNSAGSLTAKHTEKVRSSFQRLDDIGSAPHPLRTAQRQSVWTNGELQGFRTHSRRLVRPVIAFCFWASCSSGNWAAKRFKDTVPDFSHSCAHVVSLLCAHTSGERQRQSYLLSRANNMCQSVVEHPLDIIDGDGITVG